MTLFAAAVAILLALLAAGCSPAPSPSPTVVVTVSPGPSLADASVTPSASPSMPTDSPAPSPSPSATPTPSPSEMALPGFATLDGVAAKDSLGHRLPVAVMVDDNVAARPQYGFNKASIVYQAPADGGEDRYMLVFQEQDAKRVEPIRSGRPYFVNWGREYKVAFAHYGGDAKTLFYLPTLEGRIYNIDALNGSGSVFHRDPRRVAPHNGYAATAAIRALAISPGAPALLPDGVGVRPFTNDLPPAQRPAKASINIPYNRGATSYTYDTANNQYLRSVAGRPQFDALSGKRVTARNVVVLFMRLSVDPNSEPHHARPVLDILGSGRAIVFHDGHAYPATWRKPTLYDVTRFFAADGTEISLVRGRIFIQVVPLRAKVTWVAAR